jgi:hypothetical protein
MSSLSHTSAQFKDEKPGAELPSDAPDGVVNDRSYKTSGNDTVPVVSDDVRIEDPIDARTADSDAQLGTCIPSIPAIVEVTALSRSALGALLIDGQTQRRTTRRPLTRAISSTSARAARRSSLAHTLSRPTILFRMLSR